MRADADFFCLPLDDQQDKDEVGYSFEYVLLISITFLKKIVHESLCSRKKQVILIEDPTTITLNNTRSYNHLEDFLVLLSYF